MTSEQQEPLPPIEEPDAEASLAIAYHFCHQPDGVIRPDWESKASLLMADFSRRAEDIAPDLRQNLDRAVVRAFGPGRGGSAIADLAGVRPARRSVDVAIVNVLPEELSATLTAFGSVEKPQMEQPFYEVQVPCRGRPGRDLSVVITAAPKPLLPHIGPPISALRDRYSPSAVFLVGIAGGRRSRVKPGDVLACQRLLYYGAGRQTEEGTAPRPQIAEPRNQFGNGLYFYDPDKAAFPGRAAAFIAALTPDQRPASLPDTFRPVIHRANTTIASGDLVIRDGQRVEALAQRYDDTICGVDQESYAFAEAVRELPWAVFRGISDLADSEQDDRWKYVAAGLAAHCLRDFLESSFVPPDVAEL